MTEADGACGSWQPDEATGLVVNGPETITFRRLLPGDYAVYVNAYGRDEQEDLESEEGVVHYFTETPFHVDVWLGNSKSVTTLVDTVTHAQAGGKWFSAGTVRSREVSHRGLCAGALDRLQEFAGLGERLLCYTWERAASAGGAVVPYPLNGAARRALVRRLVHDVEQQAELRVRVYRVDHLVHVLQHHRDGVLQLLERGDAPAVPVVAGGPARLQTATAVGRAIGECACAAANTSTGWTFGGGGGDGGRGGKPVSSSSSKKNQTAKSNSGAASRMEAIYKASASPRKKKQAAVAAK